MTEVFADSFHFIALLNRRDRMHTAAVAASKEKGRRLITTHWVLVEVADALCDPLARQITERLVRTIGEQPNTEVVSNPKHWFDVGLKLYRNRPDKEWSLTDCISFEVMTARGIQEALSGDHHFAQAGFTPLLLPPAGA